MKNKWDHINKFLREEMSEAEIRKQKKVVQKREKYKRNSLIARVKKPIDKFDYQIDSYFNFIYRSLMSPSRIAQNESSGKYFLFGVINYFVFLLVLFAAYSMKAYPFNYYNGLHKVAAAFIFTLTAIFFTFLIQAVALNRNNTFYKVFVDSVSYYTLYNVILIFYLISSYLFPMALPYIVLMGFFVLMIIPMKLFMIYKQNQKIDVDIFPLYFIFLLLMMIYMFLTRQSVWLEFFKVNMSIT